MAFRFHTSVDAQLIRHIADRARDLPASTFPAHKNDKDLIYRDVQESVSLCHLSHPLDLRAFLNAKDPEFIADVVGILTNLNLWPGPLLKNGFTPRFAKANS